MSRWGVVTTRLVLESSNTIGTRNEVEYDTGPAQGKVRV